ncbi:hypothetical protein BH11MYX3_BH11MYX3_18440 [soil metagenome]
MSTSDRIVDNKFAKLAVTINALVPAALLAWDAFHNGLGVNDVNFAIKTTGLIGLILLVLSLLITPLRKLTGWQMLIAVRRNLGVIGFLYIAAHFLIFFWWDQDRSLRTTFSEIIDRPYLWFGFGALVLMIPLAVTSTDGMLSRLGAKTWKLLHRLAYPAIIAGVIHYLLLVKSDHRQPTVFAVILGAALLYRIVAHYLELRGQIKTAHEKIEKLRTAAPTPKKFWSGTLKIARIFDETHDVRTFRFVSPDGGALPFQHVAGQYLNLQLTIDGKRVNRSYTIASSPTRSAYCEISVKKAVNGYGSKHLHETWKEGDLVRVSAPAGTFVFAGHESERVVLLAGGIGITPMMSVVRSLTDRGWKGDIYLVFSIRFVRDVVFREELAYLQARVPNLHIRITISGDPDAAWDGARGNITRELLTDFVPSFTRGPVLVCGPDPMMTAMRKLLVGMGIPDADVHQEAFISPPAIEANPPGGESPAHDEPALADGEVAKIAFQKSGTETETAELTVLEAAEEAGVAIPFECRSGICGQCKTKLVSGKVRMENQDALTAADRGKGLILACQARPTRDCVIDA